MIYLNTRSANIDYDWFGSEDCKSFWKDFDDCKFQNDTNSIELYAEIDSSEFQIYFGKIPSDRVSRANQCIYSKLVCKGKRGSDESKLFFNLISYFLDDKTNQLNVGKIFEKYFSSDFINSLDEKRKNPEIDSQISEKMSYFLNEIPKSYFRSNGFTISDKIIFDNAEDSKNDFLSLLFRICDNSKLNTDKLSFVFSSFKSESKISQFTEIIKQKGFSVGAFVLTDKSDFLRKEIDLKKKVQKFSNPNSQQNGTNSPSDLNKKDSVQENSSSYSSNFLQKKAFILLVLGLVLGLIFGYKFSETFSSSSKKIADLENQISKLNEEKERLSSENLTNSEKISKLETEVEEKNKKISEFEQRLNQINALSSLIDNLENETKQTTESNSKKQYEISETDEYNLKIVKMVLNEDSEKAKELYYNDKRGNRQKIKDAISELKLSDEDRRKIGKALSKEGDEKKFF